MGNLCDIVAADDQAIAALDIDDDYWEMFPCLSNKSVEIVKLGTLQSIITRAPFDPSLSSQPLIREFSEDGPWVSRIPQPIITALLLADDNQIEKLSSEWVTTEEMQLDRWDLPETIAYLKQLRDFIRSANETNKSLYLFMSL